MARFIESHVKEAILVRLGLQDAAVDNVLQQTHVLSAEPAV